MIAAIKNVRFWRSRLVSKWSKLSILNTESICLILMCLSFILSLAAAMLMTSNSSTLPIPALICLGLNGCLATYTATQKARRSRRYLMVSLISYWLGLGSLFSFLFACLMTISVVFWYYKHRWLSKANALTLLLISVVFAILFPSATAYPEIIIALPLIFPLSALAMEMSSQQDPNHGLRLSHMIRNANHDLSNPVTLILGLSQIALNEKSLNDPKKMRTFWEKAYFAAEKLNQILLSVRSFDQIQKTETPQLSRLLLTELEEFIQITFESLASRREVTVEIDPIAPRDSKISTEPRLLKQACLSTIVYNAILASEPGSVVKVGMHCEDGQFVFKTENYGRPISQATIDHLFDFAFVDDNFDKKDRQPAGFRLSIAHTVAKFLGGSLTVKNGPNAVSVTLKIPQTFELS